MGDLEKELIVQVEVVLGRLYPTLMFDIAPFRPRDKKNKNPAFQFHAMFQNLNKNEKSVIFIFLELHQILQLSAVGAEMILQHSIMSVVERITVAGLKSQRRCTSK